MNNLIYLTVFHSKTNGKKLKSDSFLKPHKTKHPTKAKLINTNHNRVPNNKNNESKIHQHCKFLSNVASKNNRSWKRIHLTETQHSLIKKQKPKQKASAADNLTQKIYLFFWYAADPGKVKKQVESKTESTNVRFLSLPQTTTICGSPQGVSLSLFSSRCR